MGIKISNLPVVTTPLAGTEEFPVVQSGVTRKATIADVAGGAAGAVSWTGVGNEAVAAGTTNNWAPTLTDISRLRVTPAGAAIITGLVGGTDGRIIVITNIGGSDLELRAQDAGSAAANRFASNGDTLLPSGASALFIYDGALSRWTRLGF